MIDGIVLRLMMHARTHIDVCVCVCDGFLGGVCLLMKMNTLDIYKSYI